MKLDLSDVRFQAFRSSGPGGQKKNKCANCIRATHEPTGVVVKATRERSMTKNKLAAIAALQEKLNDIDDAKLAQLKRERYDAKPSAAFGGNQVRTYRFVGPPGVTDHRSGGHFGLDVLDGNLDPVISLRAQKDRRGP